MICIDCSHGIEQTDTTYSNYDSNRVREGVHTGNIFTCFNCDTHYIEDFINGETRKWEY